MTETVLIFDAKRNRRLLALALPMILSNVTVPLLGLVDTAVIGHLSNAYYLGGVALGSTIITLIFWLLGFLRMATTGLVAQAWGANDTQRQFQLLLQGTSLTLLLSLSILLLQGPILSLALAMSDASSEVVKYCREYFQIRIWSAPFALLNLVLLGYLLGRQQPKAAMWQLIIANCINIVLDLLLVIGLGWGVKGAALASVIADIAAMMVALTMVCRQLKLQGGFNLMEQLRALRPTGYSQLLKLNTDIFIRSLCLQAAFAFMTFHGASLGDETVAANAVLLNLLLLISYALDGIAYYAEAETGRTWGNKDMQELRNTVSLAFQWSAIAAAGFSLLFLGTGELIIRALTNIAPVQALAIDYLPWLIGMPLLAFGSYLFDGVYIGTAQGKIMRNSMLFCTLVVFFPVWWSLQSYGNSALWAAMSTFMLTRSLTLGLHYRLVLSR
ncbi:MAG: MATE family efflux transporter [Shewanella sp.]|nr:MATE family efflux transporter [Shewanella sp.]MCF1430284.1 MATE family efflux transporter [Shewanella sp.]MCF1458451.1 MATE family efflux transporter [Shewanella sp.]